MKWKIIITRESSIYDWIIKNKIWVTSLAEHLRSCRIVLQLILPENPIKVWSVRDTYSNLVRHGKINKCHYIFLVYALETTAFTLKRASSWSDESDTICVMAWVVTQIVFSYLLVCIACVKCLQPKSDKYMFIRLSQRNSWVFLLSLNQRQMLFVGKSRFYKKVVLAK